MFFGQTKCGWVPPVNEPPSIRMPSAYRQCWLITPIEDSLANGEILKSATTQSLSIAFMDIYGDQFGQNVRGKLQEIQTDVFYNKRVLPQNDLNIFKVKGMAFTVSQESQGEPTFKAIAHGHPKPWSYRSYRASPPTPMK